MRISQPRGTRRLRLLDGLVNVCEILFHAVMVNNLADGGDVLVKRKKFVGGRSVGRSTCGSWCALSRTSSLYLAACLLVANIHLCIVLFLNCFVVSSILTYPLFGLKSVTRKK